MLRTDIHQQIEEVTEKIQLLNRQLSQSSRVLKAETDLLLAYLQELQQLFAKLQNTADWPAKIPKSDIIIHDKKQPILPELQADDKSSSRQTAATEPVIAPDTTQASESPVVVKEKKGESPPASSTQTTGTSAHSINERFKRQTIELGEKLHAQTTRHLKDFFSRSDKFMFVSELFKNEPHLFEETIKMLNDLETWDDALHHIEKELQEKFNWNKKKDVAEQFKQIVKKRFLKKTA